jgi:hypothetical protein
MSAFGRRTNREHTTTTKQESDQQRVGMEMRRIVRARELQTSELPDRSGADDECWRQRNHRGRAINVPGSDGRWSRMRRRVVHSLTARVGGTQAGARVVRFRTTRHGRLGTDHVGHFVGGEGDCNEDARGNDGSEPARHQPDSAPLDRSSQTRALSCSMVKSRRASRRFGNAWRSAIMNR